MRRMLAVLAGMALAQASVAADVGGLAPSFEQARLTAAGTLSLAELHGRVVLLDFWASWCAPCLQSLPLYAQLRAEFARTDFEIVAISVDESVQDARDFLARRPVDFPTLHDPTGQIAQAYGVKAMPSSYLIDRDGTIRQVHLGFDSDHIAQLRAEIRALTGVSDAAQ